MILSWNHFSQWQGAPLPHDHGLFNFPATPKSEPPPSCHPKYRIDETRGAHQAYGKNNPSGSHIRAWPLCSKLQQPNDTDQYHMNTVGYNYDEGTSLVSQPHDICFQTQSILPREYHIIPFASLIVKTSKLSAVFSWGEWLRSVRPLCLRVPRST